MPTQPLFEVVRDDDLVEAGFPGQTGLLPLADAPVPDAKEGQKAPENAVAAAPAAPKPGKGNGQKRARQEEEAQLAEAKREAPDALRAAKRAAIEAAEALQKSAAATAEAPPAPKEPVKPWPPGPEKTAKLATGVKVSQGPSGQQTISHPMLGVLEVPEGMDPHKLLARKLKTMREAVRKLLEHYFSEGNWGKDEHLRSLANESGFVPISSITDFERLKELTVDVEFICSAVKDSSVVELSSCGQLLRRRQVASA